MFGAWLFLSSSSTHYLLLTTHCILSASTASLRSEDLGMVECSGFARDLGLARYLDSALFDA